MDTFQDPREKRREVRCKVHCKENWLVFNFLPHFATSSTLCARASLAGPGWCHCCNRSKPKVCIKSVAATALVQICAVNRNPNDWFKLSEQIRRSTAQSLLMQNKAKSRVSNLPLRAKTQRHKVTSLTAKLLRDSGHSAIACSLQSPASASVWTQSPCQGKAGQRLKRKFMRLQHCSLLLTWFETHGILFLFQNPFFMCHDALTWPGLLIKSPVNIAVSVRGFPPGENVSPVTVTLLSEPHPLT